MTFNCAKNQYSHLQQIYVIHNTAPIGYYKYIIHLLLHLHFSLLNNLPHDLHISDLAQMA